MPNQPRDDEANDLNASAVIRNNVPLPGASSFDRVVPFEIDDSWFDETTTDTGVNIGDYGAITTGPEGGIQLINKDCLVTFYTSVLAPQQRPSLRLAGVYGQEVLDPPPPHGDLPIGLPVDLRDDVAVQARRRKAYLEALATDVAGEVGQRTTQDSTLRVPAAGVGQSIQEVIYDVRTAGLPHLALIETWQVSSFLGDYGLGRTLQTFTLLPGERTTISVDTWRTDASAREDASSVFDSNDVASQDRFTQELSNQSGSAFQDQGGWSMSVGVKASASGGIGLVSASASVEAGFAANHQEARQTFSQNVAQTNREHAGQVNSSRRQEVSQTQSARTEQGTSQSTVREISNTNLRRVLNFVFRELNQEYETITALRDVKVAFYNGCPGSAEIVPLAGLSGLLERYIIPERRDQVARALLTSVVECVDHSGTPQCMLQVGVRKKGRFEWQDATLNDDGSLAYEDDPLARNCSWRIKSGPIGQDGRSRNVAGVITNIDAIALRTDNIVGEGLLGTADCLDSYASSLQDVDLDARRADVLWRNTQTRRMADALDIVKATDAKDRAAAFTEMLVDPPQIEVVSAATATRNGDTP